MGKHRWDWGIFDRMVGVFAAGCAGIGAYFTYKAAYPSSSAPSPQTGQSISSAGNIMTTGAPWWALALLSLAVILLIVSLTRSKRMRGINLPASQNDAPPISTPELASNLRGELTAINADLNGQINQQGQRFSAELSNTASRLREGIAEVNNRLVAHIAEVQNLMSKEARARESAINNVAQIAHKLGLQFQTSEISLNHLLFFAVNSVTVQFLDRVIAESPLSHCKNVAQYNDLKELEEHRVLLEAYVRNVPGWLGDAGSRRQHTANIIKNAQNEMERILLNSSERDRPTNIDPFIFRRYVIAELQCQWLVTFLETERNQVAGQLTGQRDDLLEQQQIHRTSEKSATP
jgi:hypothetical protein